MCSRLRRYRPPKSMNHEVVSHEEAEPQHGGSSTAFDLPPRSSLLSFSKFERGPSGLSYEKMLGSHMSIRAFFLRKSSTRAGRTSMKALIIFWYGANSPELPRMARRVGFQFDNVIRISSHWMTDPQELCCVKAQDFQPTPGSSYVVITNKAEHNQLVPVIAKLQKVGAEYAVYEFYYRELRKLWPLDSN